ncbi:MAG: hypothetical protein L3J43_04820 [Sulfurovum sp.]|nr:hypothetical protein [Sulfurovum sp.]
MSKKDTLQSFITSLRYGLSLLLTISFLTVGFLANDYRNDTLDEVTLSALALAIISLITAIVTQGIINKKSKELTDL